jgi:hypothetical protein
MEHITFRNYNPLKSDSCVNAKYVVGSGNVFGIKKQQQTQIHRVCL